jgi:tetratricopeptide (TPR) repeat protein
MCFLDDAIAEFEQSAESPELGREVSVMLAMCYKDKGEIERAVESYRKAIDMPGADQASMNGARYELAELLLQTGGGEEALELFRSVRQDDPSFRDVGDRIQQLEAGASD